MCTPVDNNLPDRVAQVCFDIYSQFGQRGKPLLNTEWTLLAAIVQSVDNELSVVSLATGTKCIGQNALSPKGDVVNDSHAEVLARRCFLRYLYEQVEKAKEKGSSDIFSGFATNGKCLLRTNVHFILFTSHVPCGDASIIVKMPDSRKRKCTFSQNDKPKLKKMNDEESCDRIKRDQDAEGLINNTDDIGNVIDIHRTGAKCIGAKQDFKLPGVGYHVLGAVRTKPGRGDPTLSVSCSDKIARWITTGLQGACLSLLVEGPVLLKYFVVAAGGPYSHAALHRALIARLQPSDPPRLLQSTLEFVHSRYKASKEAKPCPTSIMWANVCNTTLEIGVAGRRQGTTKKTLDKGRLMICKLELFRKFMSLTSDRYRGMTYREVKNLSVEYQDNWKLLKKKLGAWAVKRQVLTDFKSDN